MKSNYICLYESAKPLMREIGQTAFVTACKEGRTTLQGYYSYFIQLAAIYEALEAAHSI